MGLVLKKDIGLGMPVDSAYVKITPSFLGDKNQWQVSVKVYLSPECREIEVIQQWISQRCSAVRVFTQYDVEIATKLGLSEDKWHEVFDPGPWNDAKEMLRLRDYYTARVVRPIQEYSYFFDAGTPGLPDGVEVSQWKQFLYSYFHKREYTHILGVVDTPYLDSDEVFSSIRDHVRTYKDIVEEWAWTDPALITGLDSEDEYFDGVKFLREVHDPTMDADLQEIE